MFTLLLSLVLCWELHRKSRFLDGMALPVLDPGLHVLWSHSVCGAGWEVHVILGLGNMSDCPGILDEEMFTHQPET